MYVGIEEVSLLSGGGTGGLPGGALDPGCSLLAGSDTLLSPSFSAQQPFSSAQHPLLPSAPPPLLTTSSTVLFLLSSAPPLLWSLIHGLLCV